MRDPFKKWANNHVNHKIKFLSTLTTIKLGPMPLHSSTQIQFKNLVEWDWSILVYIGCDGLVHPNPIQNVKKHNFLMLDPSYFQSS
jgi:hypothetical protein